VKKWYPLVLVLLASAFSAWAYPQMPQRVVTHWGLNGDANGWSGPLVTVLEFPLLMAMLSVLFHAMRDVDPRKENYDKFEPSLDSIMAALLLTIAGLHVMVVGTALGWHIAVRRAVPALIGLFLLTIGNVLPRVRANSFIGIRTPWTLSNGESWSLMQRIAGYGLVVAGGLFLLDSAVAKPWADDLAIAATIFATLGTVLYSAIRGILSGE
jgi:uncharacterized membrane protein